ncbi:MAG: UDP-N-acetylmuramate--L-alanine ligase [Acidimicrobiales bacterium]|nr:UDP-N-acetylmuramate--L-alanine ligase [Acidimicrobiales bacterium]
MSDTDIDLSAPKRIHILGVGGTGMSPIATILAGLGHQVSGSDLAQSANSERLVALGIDVRIGHAAANLGDVDLLARSTAVGDDNPEIVEARRRGIPVVSRAAILRAITALRRTVAVAGTHGKTTTTSMLALIALDAGMSPSLVVGADPNELGVGAVWGDGDVFVVEADESDGTFVQLVARAGIVTSIEPDHLNHYADLADLEAAFDRFLGGIDGPVAVCLDDAGARRLAERHAGRPGLITYGEHPDATVRIERFEPARDASALSLAWHPPLEPAAVEVALSVPGRHNAQNAAGAAALAVALGASTDAVCSGLGRFTGVARRFQRRGEAAGVTFVDDYAHLPTEVAAVLEAASDGGWGRIVCVFQPHRYSRTAALWHTFADAFDRADVLAVCDVYSSGESPVEGINGKLIVNAVLDAHPGQRVAWLPERADLRRFLAGELRAGDLCLTLGAGDLTVLPDELIEALGGVAGG